MKVVSALNRKPANNKCFLLKMIRVQTYLQL